MKEVKNKVSVREQARQILGLPYLKDKVFCYVSSWERGKNNSYGIAEEDEKEYSFQEFALFEGAYNWLQTDGDFSFIAFREFKDIDDEDIDFEEIERLKKTFPAKKPKPDADLNGTNLREILSMGSYDYFLSKFLTKKSLQYFRYQQKIDNLRDSTINLLPTSVEYMKHFKEIHPDLIETHTLDILCIDYACFPNFILNHFLRYLEYRSAKKELIVSDDLKPLYDLFKRVSSEIKWLTYYELKILIDRAFDSSLYVGDWDKIDFLSSYRLENTRKLNLWEKVKKYGYLCRGNSIDVGLGLCEDKQRYDFKVFYSFESLLYWELKNCLKRIKRCANCGAIIGEDNKKYKGRYCPADSPNYKKCCLERNRKRQKKYYNLTKT